MPKDGVIPGLIQGLGAADRRKGIRIIDRSLAESFHPYPEIHESIVGLVRRFRADGLQPGEPGAATSSLSITRAASTCPCS